MQRLLVTTAAMAVLSGCSWFGDGSSTDYKSASTLPPLEVPPDLTSPQRDNRYQIPDSATRSTATFSGYEAERRDPQRARGSARRRSHAHRALRVAALARGAGDAREALAGDQAVLAGRRIPHQAREPRGRRDGDRLGRK